MEASAMPYIQIDSVEEDRCTLFLSDHVAISDITRADAEAVLAAYKRVTGGA